MTYSEELRCRKLEELRVYKAVSPSLAFNPDANITMQTNEAQCSFFRLYFRLSPTAPCWDGVVFFPLQQILQTSMQVLPGTIGNISYHY